MPLGFALRHNYLLLKQERGIAGVSLVLPAIAVLTCGTRLGAFRVCIASHPPRQTCVSATVHYFFHMLHSEGSLAASVCYSANPVCYNVSDIGGHCLVTCKTDASIML